jgi:SNF2 family DNA or RNA helicase
MVFSLHSKSKQIQAAFGHYKSGQLTKSENGAASPKSLDRRTKPSNIWNSIWPNLDSSQRQAVQFAIDVQTSALYWDQGTGKTWITGGIIEKLQCHSSLIVCKLTNLESTWVAFIKKMLPQVSLFLTFDDFKESEALHRILLLNYEGLRPVIKRIKKFKFDFIALDEAHTIKNRNTKAARQCRSLKGHYRTVLTGTPMDKQPVDLWSQFAFLDLGILGLWGEFEKRFLEPIEKPKFKGTRKGSLKWVRIMRKMMIDRKRRKFDFNKLREFLTIVKPYCWRVMSDEVLKLPELTVTPMYVTMRGMQRRLYDTMDIKQVVTLPDRSKLIAPIKVVKNMRLHQICGGYLPNNEGQIFEVGRAKIRLVKQLIVEHAGKRMVIFCQYVEEVSSLVDIIRKLGYKVEYITGENKKHRSQIISDFQAGKLDFLVNQIRSGGIGVDLFIAQVGIVYSMRHSSIDFNQAIKRLHRRGQTADVKIILILARNSVDEDILSDVNEKGRLVKRVLTPLRRKHHGT